MGNGDCDFGARPTKHTARVMCCKFYLVLHITYLAESCDSVNTDRFTKK